MANTAGIIDNVKTLETKFGPMLKIQVANTWYTVKQKRGEEMMDLQAGDQVSFDAKQDKQWWNAYGVVKGGNIPTTPLQSLQEAARSQNPTVPGSDDREKRIVRQMALKAGVELAAFSCDPNHFTAEEIRTIVLRHAFWVYKVAYYEDKWLEQVAILGEV